DQEPHRNATCQSDGANGGHNQVTEHEQDPGDADEDRHHDAERRVKEKDPPPHTPFADVGFFALERDEQKISSENKMDDADHDENREAFPNFSGAHDGDVADEHVPNFFV